VKQLDAVTGMCFDNDMSNTATCNHGNEVTDCKICYKRPHECDYGTCCRKGTIKVENSHGEIRKGCAKHAKYMGKAVAA